MQVRHFWHETSLGKEDQTCLKQSNSQKTWNRVHESYYSTSLIKCLLPIFGNCNSTTIGKYVQKQYHYTSLEQHKWAHKRCFPSKTVHNANTHTTCESPAVVTLTCMFSYIRLCNLCSESNYRLLCKTCQYARMTCLQPAFITGFIWCHTSTQPAFMSPQLAAC